MKTMAIAALLGLLGSIGCATRPNRFPKNSIYVLDNGRVVLKGTRYSAHSICVLDPGPVAANRVRGVEADARFKDIVAAGVSKQEALELELLYQKTERLAALDTVLGQMCVAYSNGAFGKTNCGPSNDEDCQETRDGYMNAVEMLLTRFSGTTLPTGT